MKRKELVRKRSRPHLKYYRSICLEGLKKTSKDLNQDSRSSGQGLNSGSPAYEAGILSTRALCFGHSLIIANDY
jgi:hypothetical protein